MSHADKGADQRRQQYNTPPLQALDPQGRIGSHGARSNFQVVPMQTHSLDLHLLDGFADFFVSHGLMVAPASEAPGATFTKSSYIRRYIDTRNKKTLLLFR